MRSVCLKCSVSEDRKMHVLYIIILFAIPSLLLAEKCHHQFKNPRTQRLETTWSCCQGYKPGSGGSCNPVCNTPCENGKCVRANICKCDEGYQNKNNDTSEGCVRKQKCVGGCGNGTCIGPSVCRCYNGYQNNNIIIQCLPACKAGCEEAHCVSPGKCDKCIEGYLKEGNECVAHKKSDDYRMSNTLTPRTEATASAESIFNVWTVGGATVFLVVVILAIAAFVIYRVLNHKNNTKNTSLVSLENTKNTIFNYIMVTQE